MQKNWELIDAERIFLPNSFDFIIETVGVYTNAQLVTKACDIMIKNAKNYWPTLNTQQLQAPREVLLNTRMNQQP